MGLFEILASLLTVAAFCAWANARFLRLPPTIGVMVLTLLASLLVVVLGQFAPGVEAQADRLIRQIDFNRTVMHGMLGFLLFAGALHINLSDLASQRLVIASLASISVVISTVIVGLLTWLMLQGLEIEIPLVFAFLFGSLISPTDPIAVMGILKQLGAPKDLETKIAGESLFNDGVGVVVFLGLLEIALGEYGFDLPHLSHLFLQEAVGGAILGLVCSLIAFAMLRSIDDYPTEILISLAVAAGGYALADRLHLSGPIAMVVAGLLLGNHGRSFAMSPATCEHLDSFWELIDETLNAVLFALIGLEMVVLRFTGPFLIAGLIAIGIVLLARWISVAVPLTLLRWRRRVHPHATRILTWGGLRGGVSVALALAIPTHMPNGELIPHRDVILAMTYVVVVFSIVVQGLTIGKVVRGVLEEPGTTGSAS